MEAEIRPDIEDSWNALLHSEFNKPYFRQLKQFLVEEKKRAVVYPPGKLIFNAFWQTPVQRVRVVILGQDPYHGPGQAHGLCFSVPDGIPKPPSLVNIFKEIQRDLGIPVPEGGNLTSWARQGVLLLNATLTVRANMAGSHQHKGWETFTDTVIMRLSDQREHIVFLLWGNYAGAKQQMIDRNRHLVLLAPHPSPLSASRGFIGCGHFALANNYLRKNGLGEINWKIPGSEKF